MASKKPTAKIAGRLSGSEHVNRRADAPNFDRRAVARTLKAARREDTAGAFEAELIARVLESKGLPTPAHFTTVAFLITTLLKWRDLPLVARQALASDPAVARAVYPHLRAAFPAEFEKAFGVYLAAVAEDAPRVLDSIQRAADADAEGSGRV